MGLMCIYAFVLFEELPEHDFVDFAAFALVDLVVLLEALDVLFAVLFTDFLPTEPQAEHFLLLAEVLLELFFVLPNIVFTSLVLQEFFLHFYTTQFSTKNTKLFFEFWEKSNAIWFFF